MGIAFGFFILFLLTILLSAVYNAHKHNATYKQAINDAYAQPNNWTYSEFNDLHHRWKR
jgi:hypothetical protein